LLYEYNESDYWAVTFKNHPPLLLKIFTPLECKKIYVTDLLEVSSHPHHRIKIGNRRATQRCNVSAFFLWQKYAVYWPEGRASSQYSVFSGQKMSLTG
jgi:hypothetical protein